MKSALWQIFQSRPATRAGSSRAKKLRPARRTRSSTGTGSLSLLNSGNDPSRRAGRRLAALDLDFFCPSLSADGPLALPPGRRFLSAAAAAAPGKREPGRPRQKAHDNNIGFLSSAIRQSERQKRRRSVCARARARGRKTHDHGQAVNGQPREPVTQAVIDEEDSKGARNVLPAAATRVQTQWCAWLGARARVPLASVRAALFCIGPAERARQ